MTGDWVVCFADLALEAVSGVRVGVGSAPGWSSGTDLPVLRTPDGAPLIPGSSLKGVLRSAAERLLAGKGVRVCDPLGDPCLGKDREVDPSTLEELCWVCDLFGSRHKAGRLTAGDLVAVGARTLVRDGVAIDRAELKARDGLKYDYEVVAPGAVFEGVLRVEDPRDGDLGLVLAVIDLVDAGLVTVGGGASRGLGRVRCTRPARITSLRASTFTPGAQPEDVDTEKERRAFERELARRVEGGRST